MRQTVLRAARQADLDLLWAFLAMAAYEPSVAAARSMESVANHLAGWRRAGDFGFIAERGGAPLGAAGARQFTPEENPAFYVDGHTPEVTIAVHRRNRGRGAGAALLGALVQEARRRGVGLCLNVRDTNPAMRLYQRAGFIRVQGSQVRNRVGGVSIGMALGAPGPET